MEYAKEIWTYIVKQKILNQAEMLSKYGFEANIKLMKYAEEIEPFDMTNREAHAAKVYFNSLFGKCFIYVIKYNFVHQNSEWFH